MFFCLFLLCSSFEEGKTVSPQTIFGLISKFLKGSLQISDLYPFMKTQLPVDEVVKVFVSLSSDSESLVPNLLQEETKQKLTKIYSLLTGKYDLSQIVNIPDNIIEDLKIIYTELISKDLTMSFNINEKIAQKHFKYVLENYHNFDFKEFLNNLNINPDFSKTECFIRLLINKSYTITKMNEEMNLGNFDQIKYIAKKFNKYTGMGLQFASSIISSNYPLKLLVSILSEYPEKLYRLEEITNHILDFNAVTIDQRIQMLQNYFTQFQYLFNLVEEKLKEHKKILGVLHFSQNISFGRLNLYTLVEEMGYKKSDLDKYLDKLNRLLRASGKEIIEKVINNAFNYPEIYTILDKYITKMRNNLYNLTNPDYSVSIFYKKFINLFNIPIIRNYKDLNSLLVKINTFTNWFKRVDMIIGNKISRFIKMYDDETVPFKKYCLFLLTGDNQYTTLPDDVFQFLSSNTFQKSLEKYGYSEVVNYALNLIISNTHYLIKEDKKKTEWYANIINLNQTLIDLKSEKITVNEILNKIHPDLSKILTIIYQLFTDINNDKTLKQIIYNIDKKFWDAEDFMKQLKAKYNGPLYINEIPSLFTYNEANGYQFNVKILFKPLLNLLDYLQNIYLEAKDHNYEVRYVPYLKDHQVELKNMIDDFFLFVDKKPFSSYLFEKSEENLDVSNNVVSILLLIQSIKDNDLLGLKKLYSAFKGDFTSNGDEGGENINYITIDDKSVMEELVIDNTTKTIDAKNIITGEYVPIEVNKLTLDEGTKIELKKLVIVDSIEIKGDSTLSPSDNDDAIKFSSNNKIEINIKSSTNGGIPHVNLGNIGKTLVYPKNLNVEIDLSKYTDIEGIKNAFSKPIKIISGRTLNAEEWMRRNVANLNIVGFGNKNVLKFTYDKNTKSTLTDDLPENSIYVQYNSQVQPDVSNGLSTGAVVGIVVGAVVIVVALIAFVIIKLRNKKQEKATISVQSLQTGTPDTTFT